MFAAVDNGKALSCRAEEIAYVTEHSRDLRGLRFFPLLCWFFVMGLVPFGTVPWRVWLPLFLAGGAFAGVGRWGIARWQDRHFGFVIATKPSLPSDSVLYKPVLLALLLFGCAGMWMAPGGHAGSFGMLIGTSQVLLPRCLDAARSNALLWLRKALYASALLTLTACCVAVLCGWRPGHQGSAWASGFVLSWMLLVLYDYWLLSHLLSPVRNLGEI